MENSNKLVRSLVFDTCRLADRSGLHTFDCALVGSSCSRLHIVPVPVDEGFEANPRAIDLKANHYLQFLSKNDGLVADMEDNWILVYPPDSDYEWAIVKSEDAQESQNRIVQSFAGPGIDTSHICGSYLVAKADKTGHLVDVDPEDIGYILALIVKTILCVSPSASDGNGEGSDKSDGDADS